MAELHIKDIDETLLEQIWYESRTRDMSIDEVVCAALKRHFTGSTDTVLFEETRLGNFDESEERVMDEAIDALKHLRQRSPAD